MNLSQNVCKFGGFIITKYTSKDILYSTEESYALKEVSVQTVNKIFHNSCHYHHTNAHSINHSLFAIHCYLPIWFSATTYAIPAALFSNHQKEEAWLPSHDTKCM